MALRHRLQQFVRRLAIVLAASLLIAATAQEAAFWEHYEVPGFDQQVFDAFREAVGPTRCPLP